MPKFYGEVGYSVMEETAPGVFMDRPVVHVYRGDIIKYISKWGTSPNGVNDDLSLNNRISIVGDAFAYEHFSDIRYVVLNGVKWAVNSVELSPPRLILSIGGVYNGAD